jgi:hypothetical protein
VSSEVEERIHKALATQPLERIENGYRLIHPGGAGVGTLRLLPSSAEGSQLVAVAEIVAEYTTAGLPNFHLTGVQRLNSWAVHGAYDVHQGRLRQTAQFSIYANEPAVHLVVQSILNAFGGQLPLGRSTAVAMTSAAVLKQQRAHHAMPPRWKTPLAREALATAATMLQEQGLAASSDDSRVWAEIPLSGDCPSRTIDPQAETALLQVNLGVPHPIAGAGYQATISLPLTKAPADATELCARLNALEMQQADFVPRLGAWGLQSPDDLPGYHCFFPAAEPLGAMHWALMWWAVRRAAWLRDRYWVPKVGLRVDG